MGRKRHMEVDTNGRLLAVSVTGADVQDQDGGIGLVRRLVRLRPWVQPAVADGGYKKRFAEAVQALAGAQLAGASCQWSADRR